MWYVGVYTYEWVKYCECRFYIQEDQPQLKHLTKARMRKRLQHMSESSRNKFKKRKDYLTFLMTELDLSEYIVGQSLHLDQPIFHLDCPFDKLLKHPCLGYRNPFNEQQEEPKMDEEHSELSDLD